MRNRTRSSLVILTMAISGIVVLIAGTASAQTPQQLQQQQQLWQQRQQQLQQNQQQLQKQQEQQKKAADANAKAADAKAKDAAKTADSAKAGVMELNGSIKEAQHAVDEAAKALKTLEDEIINAQSADSDFGKARDAFRAAQQKYADARKSVLESDDFKERLAKARETEESDESSTAVADLRKEFQNMPEIADPRTTLKEVKQSYEPLRTKLLEADPKWAEADKDLKAKRTALEGLEKQYGEALSAAAKAKSAARKAGALAGATNAGQTGQSKKGKHP